MFTFNSVVLGPTLSRKQKDIPLLGTYYINPLLLKVITETVNEIIPGEMAVAVRTLGKNPSTEVRPEMAQKVRLRREHKEMEHLQELTARLDAMDDERTVEQIKQDLLTGDPADRRLGEDAHEAHVVLEGCCGLQEALVEDSKPSWQEKLWKLTDSNLFWGGGVGLAGLSYSFEWAKAPTTLTITTTAISWLIMWLPSLVSF